LTSEKLSELDQPSQAEGQWFGPAENLELTPSLVAISCNRIPLKDLILTKKLQSTAGLVTIMQYLGFNHHYARTQDGVRYKTTQSTVLDFLRLSKSKLPIVKELIRRMVEQSGPEYPFC